MIASSTIRGEVVVPGSVANLGGGFDTLGVAVQLYLRARIVNVRDDGAARLTVTTSTPPVRGQNAVERAFEAIARRTGVRAPSVDVEVESDIPMAAGLGSSAAATVAGLRLFERVTKPAADSVLQVEQGDPVAMRWAWPDDVQLVVATPAVGLATAKARAALADHVSRADAIFNLQRVLALVHALQHGEYDRIREAVRDRWHQPARASLVPLLGEVLAIDAPDVLGAFLSGAGPSVALLVRRDAGRVEQLLTSLYARAGVDATIRTLDVHQTTPAPALSVGH